MSPSELERYLQQHIPLSAAMQVSVLEIQPDRVVLSAPLKPNINHRETVFGGSAAALAVLAAWSLVHTRLLRAGLPSRLVIQRNCMSFELPITGTFTASSRLAPTANWEQFLRILDRKRVARIAACCDLLFEGRTAGRFEGEFVALGPDNRVHSQRDGATSERAPDSR
ncbi:MAG: YiiD C-terminal domain-containing protein [Woeseia sp.]